MKNFWLSLSLLILLSVVLHFGQRAQKDHIIIRVFLTYHRDVMGQNLNPDLLYQDGKKWVNDPQYGAVKYP